MPAKTGGERLSDSNPLPPDLLGGFDFCNPNIIFSFLYLLCDFDDNFYDNASYLVLHTRHETKR